MIDSARSDAATTANHAQQAQATAQTSKAQAVTDQTVDDVQFDPDIPFSHILNEDGKPAMTIFQMFVWTFVSIIVYFILFWMTLSSMLADSILSNIETLKIPDIDTTMVTLMGLSQGAYVAGKISKST